MENARSTLAFEIGTVTNANPNFATGDVGPKQSLCPSPISSLDYPSAQWQRPPSRPLAIAGLYLPDVGLAH
jgi:hypothetical protein